MIVCVRDVSTGHLGNGPELQPMEGRENSSCGNFVSYGSWTFHDKLLYFVWNMFRMLVQECLRFLILKVVLVYY
jgi:hypothetical protein